MNVTVLKNHKTFEGHTVFAEHDSETTKTKMKFSYFLPESGKPKSAIVWLSGLTCTEENFITKAGAQKYLAEKDAMIICPDTSPRGLNLPGEHDSYDFGSGAGFYVNALTDGYKDHYKMYDYVVQDIVAILESEFKVSKISISGHSMGGHGALVIGLREKDTFSAVSAFSPIVHPSGCPWGEKAFLGYLGEEREAWKEYDSCELLLKGTTRNDSLLVEQGTDDEFLKNQLHTDRLETACREVGQKLEVNYRKGYDHSYYFISSFVNSHIDFLCR
ncbi:MAG: S-formylglutathione hydrolase [Bdellovibrionales bacterium]|nr:S-formylglutathione hydrolase [Bdellovibrionales bacterium]